jgi:hypothetical protein
VLLIVGLPTAGVQVYVPAGLAVRVAVPPAQTTEGVAEIEKKGATLDVNTVIVLVTIQPKELVPVAE